MATIGTTAAGIASSSARPTTRRSATPASSARSASTSSGNSAAAPQWQVFVEAVPGGTYGGQTVAAGDFGGSALYMIKSFQWSYPPAVYTDSAWTSEMNRLDDPLYNGTPVSTPLRYGDVVMVQANAPGMFYNGKFNINEQHSTDPANDFSITILQRGVTPSVADITLAALKDTNSNFIFDATRATGCEHYQGGLVHLDNLTLVDPADWTLGGTVTVKSGNLTFPMQIGLDSALSSIDPSALQTTPFSVTAILDQEDEGGTVGSGSLRTADGYTGNYSLWLTSASALTTVPEPGSLTLLAAAAVIGLLAHGARRRQRAGQTV
jgi:hypothetical protein